MPKNETSDGAKKVRLTYCIGTPKAAPAPRKGRKGMNVSRTWTNKSLNKSRVLTRSLRTNNRTLAKKLNLVQMELATTQEQLTSVRDANHGLHQDIRMKEGCLADIFTLAGEATHTLMQLVKRVEEGLELPNNVSTRQSQVGDLPLIMTNVLEDLEEVLNESKNDLPTVENPFQRRDRIPRTPPQQSKACGDTEQYSREPGASQNLTMITESSFVQKPTSNIDTVSKSRVKPSTSKVEAGCAEVPEAQVTARQRSNRPAVAAALVAIQQLSSPNNQSGELDTSVPRSRKSSPPARQSFSKAAPPDNGTSPVTSPQMPRGHEAASVEQTSRPNTSNQSSLPRHRRSSSGHVEPKVTPNSNSPPPPPSPSEPRVICVTAKQPGVISFSTVRPANSTEKAALSNLQTRASTKKTKTTKKNVKSRTTEKTNEAVKIIPSSTSAVKTVYDFSLSETMNRTIDLPPTLAEFRKETESSGETKPAVKEQLPVNPQKTSSDQPVEPTVKKEKPKTVGRSHNTKSRPAVKKAKAETPRNEDSNADDAPKRQGKSAKPSTRVKKETKETKEKKPADSLQTQPLRERQVDQVENCTNVSAAEEAPVTADAVVPKDKAEPRNEEDPDFHMKTTKSSRAKRRYRRLVTFDDSIEEVDDYRPIVKYLTKQIRRQRILESFMPEKTESDVENKGSGRSTRGKTVNYAEPKINKKIRRGDPTWCRDTPV